LKASLLSTPLELLERHVRVLKVHDPFAKRTVAVSMSEFEKNNPCFMPDSLTARQDPVQPYC
jgi:hypothetical protein